MKKVFLNPNKTLNTCIEKSCDDCKITNKVVCHFNGGQLFRFLALNIPLFFAAGYVIFKFSALLLIPWGIFIFLYFGLIEIRVMCSHCPHYAEPDIKSLKCWANYGSPKIWKYRPGPMSILEKIIFISGFAMILFPPIVILFIQQNFIFAIVYSILLVLWKFLLKVFYCNRCINFACPFNAVDNDTKESFFDKNEIVKVAWKNKNTSHNRE